jgi:hypothetical protein
MYAQCIDFLQGLLFPSFIAETKIGQELRKAFRIERFLCAPDEIEPTIFQRAEYYLPFLPQKDKRLLYIAQRQIGDAVEEQHNRFIPSGECLLKTLSNSIDFSGSRRLEEPEPGAPVRLIRRESLFCCDR